MLLISGELGGGGGRKVIWYLCVSSSRILQILPEEQSGRGPVQRKPMGGEDFDGMWGEGIRGRRVLSKETT